MIPVETGAHMRLLVRLLAIALALVFVFVVGGQYLPEGSPINQAADSLAEALRLHWMISPITGY